MYYHILFLFSPSSFKENSNNGHVRNLLCLENTSVPIFPLIPPVIPPSIAGETEAQAQGTRPGMFLLSGKAGTQTPGSTSASNLANRGKWCELI